MSSASLNAIARRLSAIALISSTLCHAGGPRFITGTTFAATYPGVAMAFYTPSPLYFTDPGNLSASVTHAQADTMVAAAAAVWNVPTASLTLAQGGTLTEHVSSDNTTINSNGVIFPADAAATNYLSKPIAIVYDSDGSITDLLLGEGASSPASCRQNGVTESVDGFGQNGTIQHAVLILNGRCVGSTPKQLTQMQYQLMRAFGRILGLGWSQLNDNVFTGSPTPTADNESFWPVMHPIDIICGPYTYQCMQNPFLLRADDLSALAQLYPVTAANLVAGKTLSIAGSNYLSGELVFPGGSGMDMVNVTVRRHRVSITVWDPSQIASGLTGFGYQQNGGNPVTGPEPGALNAGRFYPEVQSIYTIARIPTGENSNMLFQTESINPLYNGEYALGPFQRPVTSMSGSPQSSVGDTEVPGNSLFVYLTQTDAASTCSTGGDGSETSPASTDPSGWWLSGFCTTGHVSWWTTTVRAGRTWAIETTALDETGSNTLEKSQPVIGVWNASDPTGTLPTLAAAPAAMNAMAPAVTQVAMPASSSDSTVRIAIADQFGGGRPDFTYKGRILVADSITPAVVGSGGGLITVIGTGFQQGNEILINGTPASISSLTSTQIVAIAPTAAKAHAAIGTAQSIEVLDIYTGGSTTIPMAFTYSSAADLLQQVSAPAALETGFTASPAFAVQVLTSDGLAPAVGATVRFSIVSGSAMLGCGSTICTLTTNSSGQAQTTITGIAAGTISVTATELSGGASVQLTLIDRDPVLAASISAAPAWLAAGATASWTLSMLATEDNAPAAGLATTWSTNSSLGLSPTQSSTGPDGRATITIAAENIPPASVNVVTGCVWATVCATWTVYGVAPTQWIIAPASGANQVVSAAASLGVVTLLVTDLAGHPLPGAAVTVYQTIAAWESACPTTGRCPSAPVLTTLRSSATSDASGFVTVTPFQLPSLPQVVRVAASTGSSGFTALTLVKTP